MNGVNPYHSLRLSAVEGRTSREAVEWIDAVVLTGLALAVSLPRIGTRSIIFDEATSILYARMSPAALFAVVTGSDPNHGLFYALLGVWVRMVGESETAARALSAGFGALAVAAVYRLGAKLFGRYPGLVAGALLALNGLSIRFAQTVRGYSLLLFLTALASYLFILELEAPARRTRAAYVVVSALAFYVHYFVVYMLVVHALALLAIDWRRAMTRRWMTTGVSMLVLVSPEILVASLRGPGGIDWIDPPSASDVRLVLVELAGGSPAVLWLTVAGGVLALVFALRQRRRLWPYGFVLTLFVVPVVLAYLASFWQPMFISYYLIGSVSGLVLSAAALVQVAPPRIGIIYSGAIVLLAIPQLTAFQPPENAENWRDAAAHILTHVQPGDGLAFYPDGARKPFEYYERRREISDAPMASRPASAEDSRIWFLVRDSDASNRPAELAFARSTFPEGYRLVETTKFRRLTVELYER